MEITEEMVRVGFQMHYSGWKNDMWVEVKGIDDEGRVMTEMSYSSTNRYKNEYKNSEEFVEVMNCKNITGVQWRRFPLTRDMLEVGTILIGTGVTPKDVKRKVRAIDETNITVEISGEGWDTYTEIYDVGLFISNMNEWYDFKEEK